MHDGRLLSCMNFKHQGPPRIPAQGSALGTWFEICARRSPVVSVSFTVLQLEIALSGVALRFPDAIGTPTMELGLYALCYIQGDNDGSFPAKP
jgi:hypothetical protein